MTNTKIKRPSSTIELKLDRTILEHKRFSLGAKDYPTPISLKFSSDDVVDISHIEGDIVTFDGTGDFEIDLETIIELIRNNPKAIKSFKCTLDD